MASGRSWGICARTGRSRPALEVRFYPPPAGAAKGRRPQPGWAAVHGDLRRPGVTLQLLWDVRRAVHPDGYGYSCYWVLYRAWEAVAGHAAEPRRRRAY